MPYRVVIIYWFHNDLRVGDNPALNAACASAARLLPVYCHDPAEDAATPWGFVRRGAHRQTFLAAALDDLDAQLRARGSRLLQLRGAPAEVLPALARAIEADTVVCEEIAAPEEQDVVAALRAAGLTVRTVWQSSLLDPAELPFAVGRLPKVFTEFRRAVESAGVQPPAPLAAPAVLPPLPELTALPREFLLGVDGEVPTAAASSAGAATAERTAALAGQASKASFPWWQPDFAGGERAALAHLARYFAGDAAQRYKTTRNGLTGIDFSSKFSPWLAQGALSARVAFAALRRHEAHTRQHGQQFHQPVWQDKLSVQAGIV